MWELRNEEDARLLEAGDHATLLATYYEVILGRCLARLRNEDDAYEVPHRVIERLIGELRRGKTYSVPYSVVVNKVIDWKVVEFFERDHASLLPEGWDEPDVEDAYETFEEREAHEQVFSSLPERAREVATLFYLRGLTAPEIAAELGIEPNNVHQALHRAHTLIRERWLGG